MQKTLFGKWLLVLALIIFLILQFTLWFGEGGLSDVRALKKAVAVQQQENEKLAERNRILQAEVNDLKIGLEAVEEHARLDLGMIKKNENFYWVTGKRNTNNEPQTTTQQAMQQSMQHSAPVKKP